MYNRTMLVALHDVQWIVCYMYSNVLHVQTCMFEQCFKYYIHDRTMFNVLLYDRTRLNMIAMPMYSNVFFIHTLKNIKLAHLPNSICVLWDSVNFTMILLSFQNNNGVFHQIYFVLVISETQNKILLLIV